MDLVVLIDDPSAKIDPGNFVESMAALLERVSQNPSFCAPLPTLFIKLSVLLAFGALTK